MMWAANNLYMINMPLFIIDELHLTDKLAGEMIGIAVGLEIPMMLIAGYYMKRIGKRLLMLIAIVSGMCFTPAYSWRRLRRLSWNCKFLMPSSLVFSVVSACFIFRTWCLKNRLCDNVICKYFTRRLDYRKLCWRNYGWNLELPCVVLSGDRDVGYCDDLPAVY